MTWTYNPNYECRAWCWTLNNYTPAHIETISKWRYAYVVYGQEVGESGTPHLQGFLYAKSAVKAGTLKKKINELHIEPAKGKPQEAADYCKKGKQSHEEWKQHKTSGPNYGLDAMVYEEGECPRQGTRTDIHAIREAVAAGKGMRDIIDLTDSYQSVRMGEKILLLKERRRNWKPEVTWIFGPSGSGKTYFARTCCDPDKVYWARANGKWWCGYDAHEDVIIQEFRWDWLAFQDLLMLLDEYPHTVESKGGSRQFLARRIFICTTFKPDKTFAGKTDEDLFQINRRVTNLIEMENHAVKQVHKGELPLAPLAGDT